MKGTAKVATLLCAAACATAFSATQPAQARDWDDDYYWDQPVKIHHHLYVPYDGESVRNTYVQPSYVTPTYGSPYYDRPYYGRSDGFVSGLLWKLGL